MIIHTAEQRSTEWFAARAGRLTGSVAKDMLAVVKSGESAKRRDLRVRLALERLSGSPQDEDGFVSKEMQRGIDMEPAARGAYEAWSGELVNTVGFVMHDTMLAGCSVDGEVDDFSGLIEAKCPKSFTHLSYLRAGEVPADYMPQITHNMWITGAQWCDFISFDDRLPKNLQLFVRRVNRDEAAIAAYELLVKQFLSEVEREVEAVLALARQYSQQEAA